MIIGGPFYSLESLQELGYTDCSVSLHLDEYPASTKLYSLTAILPLRTPTSPFAIFIYSYITANLYLLYMGLGLGLGLGLG